MGTVRVVPDPFTLISYDAGEIRALVEDAAALVDLPNVDVVLEVDEELFAPLTGHSSDVVNGEVHLWISGANFEDNRLPTHFSADQARSDLVVMLLRAKDRLSEAFRSAPPDHELTRAERIAWDTYAVGRARQLGLPMRRQRQLYDFRLQHGFSDVADTAFERCWNAPTMTWDGIRELCKETGAADRADSRIPVDLLRQSKTA